MTRGGGGAGQAQAQVRPQARPAPTMPFGSTPVGGGMPAARAASQGPSPQAGIPMPLGAPSPQAGIPMPMGRPSPQEGMPIPAGADPEFGAIYGACKARPYDVSVYRQRRCNAEHIRNV